VQKINLLFKHAFIFSFALIFATIGTIGFGSQLNALTLSGPRDCDNNAIIHCGALSTEELQQKFADSEDVQRIFSHFGIRQQHIDRLNSAVAGQVHSNNTVTVNGQVVAEDVMTLGRTKTAGSTAVNYKNGSFYKRSPSDSFASGSLPAFVVMQNGRFQYAVIASCGNPVIKRPTAKQTQPEKPQQPAKQQPTASASASASAVAHANVTNVYHQHQHTQEQKFEHKQQPAKTEAATSAKTEVTPTASKELPKTGTSVFMLAGMSGMLAGAGHYIFTRRRG